MCASCTFPCPCPITSLYADIINTQLRSREVDLAEAQHSASVAQAEAAALRAQLAAAKQAAAADAAAMETRLAANEAEVWAGCCFCMPDPCTLWDFLSVHNRAPSMDSSCAVTLKLCR
jgi:hypothetical protein